MGTFQRLIGIFQQAFEGLQASVPPLEVESLAIMIHRVMTVQTRNYHTLDHVFNLSDPSDPIQSLAALFHDLVYYQVDRGFAPEVYPIVSLYIREIDGELFIADPAPSKDRPFALALEVFGFEPRQKLSSSSGLNEFLSAVVANTRLGGTVSEQDLLKIAACIEATIPFRGKDAQGKTHFDVLASRLRRINEKYCLSLTPAEIEEATKCAVVFANKDVSSFCEQDVGVFLDSTWKLLPETNIALRSGQIYTVREYRQALWKMEVFLSSLDADNIFHDYGEIPAKDEFQRMVALAHTNISIAREYLGVKLLPIAIYEALAQVTGGDVPLAFFMGDIQKAGEQVIRLEDFLPAVEMHRSIDQSSIVFKLLDTGRASESNFDMKNSPTSTFIFKSLGPEGARSLLDNAKAMFDGALPAGEFLARTDQSVLAAIARASAAMVPTRREKLLQYAL